MLDSYGCYPHGMLVLPFILSLKLVSQNLSFQMGAVLNSMRFNKMEDHFAELLIGCYVIEFCGN